MTILGGAEWTPKQRLVVWVPAQGFVGRRYIEQVSYMRENGPDMAGSSQMCASSLAKWA